MYKILYIIILAVTILITSCKKCEDGKKVAFWNDCPPAPVNTTLQQLQKTWKVIRVTQSGYTIPIYQDPLNGIVILEDYSKYRITFLNATDYKIVERDGNITNGKWELINDNKKIILNKGTQDKEKVYNILLIDNSSLKIFYSENNSKTGNRELTIELIPT